MRVTPGILEKYGKDISRCPKCEKGTMVLKETIRIFHDHRIPTGICAEKICRIKIIPHNDFCEGGPGVLKKDRIKEKTMIEKIMGKGKCVRL